MSMSCQEKKKWRRPIGVILQGAPLSHEKKLTHEAPSFARRGSPIEVHARDTSGDLSSSSDEGVVNTRPTLGGCKKLHV